MGTELRGLSGRRAAVTRLRRFLRGEAVHQTSFRWAIVLLLAGCSTPYEPPVVVHGGADFPGIAHLLERTAAKSVHVVLVHGMCTHNADWAEHAISSLARSIDQDILVPGQKEARNRLAESEIQIVQQTVPLRGGVINFSAIVWSPLTTKLKRQLDYDKTKGESDCAAAGTCRPQRARWNAMLKDGLLNDCLADALAYQGRSRAAMRTHMIEALTQVFEESKNLSGLGTLAIVSESLGSKLVFDALEEMALHPDASGRSRDAGTKAIQRLGLVFMAANQLPMLGLADQVIRDGPADSARGLDIQGEDSLQRLLKAADIVRQTRKKDEATAPMGINLVAFTDPNDLLSYRLQPSRYNSAGVGVTDVLVSNTPAYLGLVARPDRAHTSYLERPAITRLIACGHPEHRLCDGAR